MCPPHQSHASHRLCAQPVSQRAFECKNCGTKATPFWRKDKSDGKPLCNACGLYHAKNDAPRPKMLWRTDENGNPIPGSSSLLNLNGCAGNGNGPSPSGSAAAAATQPPSVQTQQQQVAVVAAAMAQFQAAMRAGAAVAGGTKAAPGSGNGAAGNTALAAALRTLPGSRPGVAPASTPGRPQPALPPAAGLPSLILSSMARPLGGTAAAGTGGGGSSRASAGGSGAAAVSAFLAAAALAVAGSNGRALQPVSVPPAPHPPGPF